MLNSFYSSLVDCSDDDYICSEEIEGGWNVPFGLNGEGSPTTFTFEEMTCASWEEGDCYYSKCLPKCMCAINKIWVPITNDDGDVVEDYEYLPIECFRVDDGDGCVNQVLGNTAAHNFCGETVEGCEIGQYCKTIKDYDLGVELKIRRNLLKVDT